MRKHPRSPLELLDTVPESLLRRLKQYSGRLATEAVSAMQERLPFFAELEASQRASVALVVQTAVVNFVEWMHDPHSNVSYTAQAFELVPQDLTRRIALRHSVDMVRVTMEFFEEVVPLLARSEEQLTALTVGILKYSRDLAFTAASAYADAAEARGTWDSRMEASVVDAVVRGDTGPELLSRAAALNWDTTAPATVVVGTPAPDRDGQRPGRQPAGQPTRPRHRRAPRPRRAHRRARHLAGGDRVRPVVADREVPRRPAECVLRRPGGDRPDGADADRGLPQRQRGDLRDERRRRLAGGAAARAGARAAARTRPDGRCVGRSWRCTPT